MIVYIKAKGIHSSKVSQIEALVEKLNSKEAQMSILEYAEVRRVRTLLEKGVKKAATEWNNGSKEVQLRDATTIKNDSTIAVTKSQRKEDGYYEMEVEISAHEICFEFVVYANGSQYNASNCNPFLRKYTPASFQENSVWGRSFRPGADYYGELYRLMGLEFESIC